MIMENRLKRLLRNGEVAIGTMVVHLRTPTIAQMLKTAGFDFIFIDCEHGGFGVEAMADLIQAARGVGFPPIVRVPRLEPQTLAHPLDLGAAGLLCPGTETRQDAELIIRSTKYHPRGERGMSLRNVHTAFAKGKGEEITRRLNEETLIILQVETARGVDNLEGLVTVEGVDAVFVGPNDLSQTLGVPGEIHHPEVTKRIERVIEACHQAGLAPGLHTYDVESAKRWLEKGIRLLGYASDVAFIVDTGTAATTELRGFLQRRKRG
ncbi:MAG: HpcH/HpaI aldolase/citrate lyase family protein [Candidatus Methylomirabilales bacterium]